IAYLQQHASSRPCPAYARDPCAPRRPDPCLDVISLQTIFALWICLHSLESRSGYAVALPSYESDNINVPQQESEKPFRPVQPPSSPRTTEERSMASWSPWSPETPCSVTCGNGVVMKKRFCSVEGQCESIKEESCNTGPCPEWTMWSKWTECSRTCGGGEQSRERVCSMNQKCDGPSKVGFY
ncbi:unnamed protein product, partial [Gongylonema pulchrum]|uniref:TSP1_spondin domain-containing protein n=1 Tax=Gongylonema pulchrum TaxID=637853 RepID=A0A183DFA8_9BILA